MLRTSVVIDWEIYEMTKQDEEVTEQSISGMIKHRRYSDHREEI